MRWLMMVAVFVLMQLLTYGLYQGIWWLMRPYVAISPKWSLWGCFLLSNALFLAAFFGLFRLSVNWLAVLWIGFLSSFVAMGLIVILGRFVPSLADPLTHRVIAVGCVLGLLGLSIYNAYAPTVRHLIIKLDKPLPAPVTLALASDLHLGALVGTGQLAKLELLLATHSVDILLMPGDIMDDNTEGFERYQMAEQLKRTLGSVSNMSVVSLGNHDLYQAKAYESINQAITDAGAILLNDDTIQVAITKHGQTTHLNIIGRYDDHYTHRKPTAELVSLVDTRYPTILLDHRPSEIESNSTLPIDLQVSGHTHNGQVFPANFIVQAINKVGYGYEKVGDTHVVVSSGYGFWGVPFRLGSQAEIWVIELKGA